MQERALTQQAKHLSFSGTTQQQDVVASTRVGIWRRTNVKEMLKG